MKKILFLFVSVVLSAFIANAQNLLINGDFEDGDFIVPWWVFIDANAAAAEVDTTDGSVNFTEITKAGGNTYDIQLIQELSEDQLAELGDNVGSNYYLSFDAIVSEPRNCNLFFGEIGGAWYNLAGGRVFNFVPSQQTYSVSINVSQVFEAMKFGLEIGTSDVPVEFDNFILTTTPPESVIENRSLLRDYHIFPNPASDLFYADVLNGTRVSLCSLTGQLIESKTGLGKTLAFDVSNLAHGLYIVKIQSDSRDFAEKIMITK